MPGKYTKLGAKRHPCRSKTSYDETIQWLIALLVMSMERYQREKDMKDLQDLGLRDGLNRNYLMKKNKDCTSKVKEVGQQMEK